MLRYAGTESATFWVETSAPCEVEILGHSTRTFAVEGHHYALLLVDDLERATVTPYDVRLDGITVWPPEDGRPGPVVRTRANQRQSRLVFGSCRIGRPQPTRLATPWPEDLRQTGIDALWTYAKQLQRGEMEWPDAVLLLGDQVYADEVSPATLDFIRSRRDTEQPPGEQIADFEEYTRLYRESWSDPDIRWLLSTVPTAMIFDDHDVHDDWNISWLWVQEMRERPWWEARITGAFMAYWIYQHLGNLSPPELAEEEMLELVKRRRGRRPAAQAGRAHVGPGVGGEPLGLLPRLRRHAATRARLACGTRARRRKARDGRRGGMGLDRRPLHRRLRPRDHRQHAAGLHAPRHPPPPGLERGTLRRALGQVAARSERASPASGRPRALAGIQPIVRASLRLAAPDRQGRWRRPCTGIDPVARR